MTLRLENVIGCSAGSGKGQPPVIQVAMDYNPNCSKNAYKTRDGYIRSDVRRWMDDLAWMIAAWSRSERVTWKPPLHVLVGGTFLDKTRCPDVHNFIIVVADAIQEGLGINDKQYKIEAALPLIDPTIEPRITVTVKELR